MNDIKIDPELMLEIDKAFEDAIVLGVGVVFDGKRIEFDDYFREETYDAHVQEWLRSLDYPDKYNMACGLYFND